MRLRLYTQSLVCALLLTGCTDQGPPATDTSSSPPTDRIAAESDDPGQSSEPVEAPFVERRDITEQELGVPLYPGARPLTGGTWSIADKFSEGANSMTSIRLETKDPIDKVADFYRARLNAGSARWFEFDSDHGKTISLTTESGAHSSSNIMLRQHEQGTRIEISVMAANHDKDT